MKFVRGMGLPQGERVWGMDRAGQGRAAMTIRANVVLQEDRPLRTSVVALRESIEVLANHSHVVSDALKGLGEEGRGARWDQCGFWWKGGASRKTESTGRRPLRRTLSALGP